MGQKRARITDFDPTKIIFISMLLFVAMDFFLDTGPIYGWADENDTSHHRDCAMLFKMYPVDVHGYYTTKSIVVDELKNLRRKRLSGTNQLIRLIERRCQEILSWIRDADYTEHREYPQMFQRIVTLLASMKSDANPKDKDASLLANAFLWESKTPGLYRPSFLTIDQQDIGNNRMEIKKIAEEFLSRESALQILLVREIVSKR